MRPRKVSTAELSPPPRSPRRWASPWRFAQAGLEHPILAEADELVGGLERIARAQAAVRNGLRDPLGRTLCARTGSGLVEGSHQSGHLRWASGTTRMRFRSPISESSMVEQVLSELEQHRADVFSRSQEIGHDRLVLPRAVAADVGLEELLLALEVVVERALRPAGSGQRSSRSRWLAKPTSMNTSLVAFRIACEARPGPPLLASLSSSVPSEIAPQPLTCLEWQCSTA